MKQKTKREVNNLISELAAAVAPPQEGRQRFYREFAEAMLEVPLEAVKEGVLTRDELVYLLLASVKVVEGLGKVQGKGTEEN